MPSDATENAISDCVEAAYRYGQVGGPFRDPLNDAEAALNATIDTEIADAVQAERERAVDVFNEWFDGNGDPDAVEVLDKDALIAALNPTPTTQGGEDVR